MAENFDGNSFDTKIIYENFNEVRKGKTFFCYKIQKKENNIHQKPNKHETKLEYY